MTRILPAALVLLASTANWARTAPPASNCEPPLQGAGPLRQDAESAENMAIRYADACCGPHSGHFDGMAEYGRRRDQCMATLFQAVAGKHGVTTEQVRWSLANRSTGVDLGVILSFVAIYPWAACMLARRIYSVDQTRLARIAMPACVIGAAIGVPLGEAWSVVIESLRPGSGHLSYRVGRLPWGQHRIELFVGCIVLFWIVAARQYRTAAARPKNAAAISIFGWTS
jgi:hypothetical protein